MGTTYTEDEIVNMPTIKQPPHKAGAQAQRPPPTHDYPSR
jgi:hypothetical protein